MEYIQHIHAREILDSRGYPTIEVEVITNKQTTASAIVPSGASTGQFEALELRDQDERYQGKGVLKAVNNVNDIIAPALINQDITKQHQIDHMMIHLDGSENKSKLGANAILGVSLAVAKCAAKSLNIPLYQYIGGMQSTTLPIPLMNIINGGAHAKNSLDVQEFMIIPIGAKSFLQAMHYASNVYHCLQKLLNMKNLSTSVGDEGGFAPDLHSIEETLDLLSEAIRQAGYIPGKDIAFGLDVASSEWKSTKGIGYYHLPKSNKDYTTDELISYYQQLISNYPVISIEDPLDEEDWQGWKQLTQLIGDKVQLVGDDLFVTNSSRLSKGIEEGCGNAILIKVNQIGTLTETLDAIYLARKAHYNIIISHRSGESEDTTIADLVVGLNCGQIKAGAPCRSERVAKYNQLIRIDEQLNEASHFASW